MHTKKVGIILLEPTSIFLNDSQFIKHYWSDDFNDIRGFGNYSVSNDELTLIFSGNNALRDSFLKTEQDSFRVQITSRRVGDNLRIEVESILYSEFFVGLEIYHLDHQKKVVTKSSTDIFGKMIFEIPPSSEVKFLEFSYLQGERYFYDIINNQGKSTELVLKYHIPFYTDGLIEKYKIKKNGKFLERSSNEDRMNLKFIKNYTGSIPAFLR